MSVLICKTCGHANVDHVVDDRPPSVDSEHYAEWVKHSSECNVDGCKCKHFEPPTEPTEPTE